MSFNASNVVIKDKITSNIENPLSPNQLNKKEIEVLLSVIRRSTFLGEDIEPLYNMIVKLQNQHLEQK
jgi:predicted XRE-type DNA-binding protein